MITRLIEWVDALIPRSHVTLLTGLMVFIIVISEFIKIASRRARRLVRTRLCVFTTNEEVLKDLTKRVRVFKEFAMEKTMAEIIKEMNEKDIILMLILGSEITGWTSKFLAHLQSTLTTEEQSEVSKMRYTIFGYGSTENECFNRLGKETDDILKGFKAKSICPMHVFDEAEPGDGIVKEFDKFLVKFARLAYLEENGMRDGLTPEQRLRKRYRARLNYPPAAAEPFRWNIFGFKFPPIKSTVAKKTVGNDDDSSASSRRSSGASKPEDDWEVIEKEEVSTS